MRRASLIASVFALLVVAAPAEAATTVGSDLFKAPSAAASVCTGDGVSCTVAQRTLASPAPGGLLAVGGVVVRWRVRNVSSARAAGVTIALRTLRGQTAVGRGPGQVVPQRTGVLEFPARIAVAAGDRLGLDMSVPAGGEAARLAAVGSTATGWDSWTPPLADGESRAPTSSRPFELLLSADIEADSDADGFGDETQDACPGRAGPDGGCPPPAPPPPASAPAPAPAPGTPGTPGAPMPGNTTQQPSLSPPDSISPRISSVTFSRTRLRFVMSERANVTIAVQRLSSGRLVRGRCRAQTRGNRRSPKCERRVTVVSGKAVAEPGRNTLYLRSRHLTLGTYRVRISALDRAGNHAKTGTLVRRFRR
jgi:hypothetical protein